MKIDLFWAVPVTMPPILRVMVSDDYPWYSTLRMTHKSTKFPKNIDARRPKRSGMYAEQIVSLAS